MRVLRGILLAVVLVVAVAVVGVWFYLDFATKRALEDGGEQLLGVETRVGSVGVQPLSGSIRLSDIRIANPSGFSSGALLEVGSGRVQIALDSLATDEVAISSITLDDLVLRLEKKGARSNYGSLGTSSSASNEEGAEDPGRRVVVRKLTLRNVTAHVDEGVHGKRTGDLVLEIPEISLRDIGSGTDGDLVAAELSEVVIAAIVNALVKKGLSLPLGLVRNLGVLPVEITGEVLRGVSGVVGGGTKVVGGVLEGTVGQAGKGVEQAAGALRSLFGKRGKRGDAAEVE